MDSFAAKNVYGNNLMAIRSSSCDHCGRRSCKIFRVYKGQRYCANCYARVFHHRLCPKCGERARLPKNEPDAICRKCEMAKPCGRCGKVKYKTGKVTPYGPVCNACAPHFRKAEPCELCGAPSPRLSRVRRFGQDSRLCPKCARADHGTCAACRRHRPLLEATDGKMLCQLCLEQGEILCQSCGAPMPAGRVSLCETCYWIGTCRKRVKMDQAAFSNPILRQAFGEYGAWLMDAVGAHKASLTIHRYLSFFLEIENRWQKIPQYPDLLGVFGAEGLRKVRLPMRWLRTTHNICPDPVAREEDSERRRIQAILDSFPKNGHTHASITAYCDNLSAKVEKGKSSMRSVRLALRPAAAVLQIAMREGMELPDQSVLDHYLRDTPGQRASVTGFVHFLNRERCLGLEVRVDLKQTRETRRRALERKIMQMALRPGEGEVFARQWLRVGLEYFHGVVITTKRIATMTIQEDGEGFMVDMDGSNYPVPRWNAASPLRNYQPIKDYLEIKVLPKSDAQFLKKYSIYNKL